MCQFLIISARFFSSEGFIGGSYRNETLPVVIMIEVDGNMHMTVKMNLSVLSLELELTITYLSYNKIKYFAPVIVKALGMKRKEQDYSGP